MVNFLSNTIAQNELPLAKVGGVTEGMVELWKVCVDICYQQQLHGGMQVQLARWLISPA